MSLIRDNFLAFRPVRPTSTDRFRTGGRTFVADHSQVFAVIAARQLIDDFRQIRLRNEFHSQRHLFQARDLEALSMFDGRNVIAGFK